MELTQYLTLSHFPQKFHINLSKSRIYLCNIPTVMTETDSNSVNQALLGL